MDSVKKIFLCEICQSAANYHPDHLVQVWMFGGIQKKLQKDHNFNIIQKHYSNVEAISMDVQEFVENSEAKNLWHKVQSSKYYISHLSDILRVLILKTFGGIYLDLDALIIKPLPPAPNFAGRQTDKSVACGLMKFQKNHPLGMFEFLDNQLFIKYILHRCLVFYTLM